MIAKPFTAPLMISPLRALQDNYIWCIEQQPVARGCSQEAIVVDPGDGAIVLAYLAKKNLQLKGILITHHHYDHTNGIKAILAKYAVPVYAPLGEKVNGATHLVSDNTVITIPQLSPDSAITIKVIAIPGHTLHHVAYLIENALFSGDTLFSAGCGRIFEGTPEVMYASLQKISALADMTLIYCGHEYTLQNLQFAALVEPENLAIAAKIAAVKLQLAKGHATLPSTLAEEKMFNPFLRCHLSHIKKRVQTARHIKQPLDTLTCFAKLREWKNTLS